MRQGLELESFFQKKKLASFSLFIIFTNEYQLNKSQYF